MFVCPGAQHAANNGTQWCPAEPGSCTALANRLHVSEGTGLRPCGGIVCPAHGCNRAWSHAPAPRPVPA